MKLCDASGMKPAHSQPGQAHGLPATRCTTVFLITSTKAEVYNKIVVMLSRHKVISCHISQLWPTRKYPLACEWK